jgi:hypothetical protein
VPRDVSRPENDETPVSTADRGLSWDTPKGCVDQPFDIFEELVRESMIRTGHAFDAWARECAQREAPGADDFSELK